MVFKHTACDACPEHGPNQGLVHARQKLMTSARPWACACYAPRVLGTLECHVGVLILDSVSR
eukprot:11218124-Lingulodinium_polyedra.AAC.1